MFDKNFKIWTGGPLTLWALGRRQIDRIPSPPLVQSQNLDLPLRLLIFFTFVRQRAEIHHSVTNRRWFFWERKYGLVSNKVRSGVGTYAGAARRRVYLATVIPRPPSGHRTGRRQARHARILQIGFRLTQPFFQQFQSFFSDLPVFRLQIPRSCTRSVWCLMSGGQIMDTDPLSRSRRIFVIYYRRPMRWEFTILFSIPR